MRATRVQLLLSGCVAWSVTCGPWVWGAGPFVWAPALAAVAALVGAVVWVRMSAARRAFALGGFVGSVVVAELVRGLGRASELKLADELGSARGLAVVAAWGAFALTLAAPPVARSPSEDARDVGRSQPSSGRGGSRRLSVLWGVASLALMLQWLPAVDSAERAIAHRLLSTVAGVVLFGLFIGGAERARPLVHLPAGRALRAVAPVVIFLVLSGVLLLWLTLSDRSIAAAVLPS